MKDIQLNLAVAALVVGILNALGAALKAIPWVANHYIPFFLATAGAVAYPAIEGWTGLNVVLGVGLALGAVGVHQVFQQGANIKKDGVGIFLLLALPLFVGCTSTEISSGNWTMKRRSFLQRMDIGEVSIGTNGTAKLKGYKNDGGNEAVAAITAAAVSAAVEAAK